MVAVSNRAERRPVQEALDYLRARSQSLTRKLQAVARLSPRAPRDRQELAHHTLALPDSEQHIRAGARHDAQDAADLDYVSAVLDASEVDYPDTPSIRPCIVRASSHSARPDLGVLFGFCVAEGCADRDLVEGVQEVLEV